jgi:hypothetical protein
MKNLQDERNNGKRPVYDRKREKSGEKGRLKRENQNKREKALTSFPIPLSAGGRSSLARNVPHFPISSPSLSLFLSFPLSLLSFYLSLSLSLFSQSFSII